MHANAILRMDSRRLLLYVTDFAAVGFDFFSSQVFVKERNPTVKYLKYNSSVSLSVFMSCV